MSGERGNGHGFLRLDVGFKILHLNFQQNIRIKSFNPSSLLVKV